MTSKSWLSETTKSDDDSTSPRGHSPPQHARNQAANSASNVHISSNLTHRSSRLATSSTLAIADDDDDDDDGDGDDDTSHTTASNVAMATPPIDAPSNATTSSAQSDAVGDTVRRRHRRTPPSVDEKALLRHRSADVAGTRSGQKPPRVRKRASSHRLSNNDAPSGSGNHNSHNTNAPAGVAEPVDVAAAVLKAPSSGARAKPRKPLNAASSGSSDSSLSMKSSSPAPMPPPSLMRSQQGGSDENVLLPEPSSLAAAPASSTQQAPAAAEPASGGGGKHGALARRTSAVLLERLNHDDEYRSATTSDTTGGGGTVAGGTDAALLGASSASLDEDGSVVVSSNGSYVLTRTKSRDSASPLPNSGDTMPLDDDARLWFGDRSRMERIISFQRSSSGRHGISQTTSGLLIRHPIVLTGPSPSKDDDSSAGTLTADAKHSSSARTSGSKHGSARAVLSFGSSPSSSDVESRRRSSGHTKRRHHRTRRGTQPPTIQPSSSVQDVLSAVGVTGAVPESLIFTVLSPTHIASLDRGAIADALSTDDGSSSTESSSSSTSLGSSSSSATPRSTHTSPMRLQVTPSPGPHVEQSPKRRVSPLSPPISPAPRTPSPQSTPSSKTSPTHDLTHVTVDDRRERIVSMKTSKSGRHTITHTETGKVITQPVFFSPGGVVMTESVPIYEAEEATTIASVAARTSAHRLRGRNNSPAATTNNLSTSPIAANTTTATAAATAATTTTTTTTTAAAAATTASTMGTTSTQQQATTD